MRKIGLATLLLAVGTLYLVSSVRALDSSLSQEIKLIDCTKTSISGSENTNCDGVIAPTITSVDTENSRLIIKGTFDAKMTRMLTVKVNNQSDILGQSQFLTASGDNWTLDFTSLAQTLPPGIYDVEVFVETVNNQLLADSTKNELVIVENSNQPGDFIEALKRANAILPQTGVVISGGNISLQPIKIPASLSGDSNQKPSQIDEEFRQQNPTKTKIGQVFGLPISWVRAGILEALAVSFILACLAAIFLYERGLRKRRQLK